MKHNLRITILLVTIFILAQLVGIATISRYYTPAAATGEPEQYKELPLNIERPEVEGDPYAIIYIVLAILIGTCLLLFLIKIRSRYISKLWFALAIWMGLSITFAAYINPILAAVIALIIAFWKVFFPNVYVSNFAEIFVYGGIAALFHEMLTLFAASIILIIISIYDIIAVWKIKHMVTMAKFQTENKMFAGAMIPYSIGKKPSKFSFNKLKLSLKSHLESSLKSLKKIKTNKIKTTKPIAAKMVKVKTAILGGGDIAFPLIFTGAVMKSFGIGLSFIITITSAIALTLLFIKAEKNKFYPAMPFISAGCFLGLGIIYLISLI